MQESKSPRFSFVLSFIILSFAGLVVVFSIYFYTFLFVFVLDAFWGCHATSLPPRSPITSSVLLLLLLPTEK
jgi:hypothetical protein